MLLPSELQQQPLLHALQVPGALMLLPIVCCLPLANYLYGYAAIQSFLSLWAGGGDANGTEYANAVSQASFRAVAVAANDVAAVFQRDAPELSSLFLVWALQETQRCMCKTQPACLLPPVVTCCCSFTWRHRCIQYRQLSFSSSWHWVSPVGNNLDNPTSCSRLFLHFVPFR